ncbi:hypothetical protein [Polaribacter sp. Hel_I_88]|uniref:hypothetical protein n=1 Tax=Polaribacter sp. Hel_I_88 TaxID=1250006 RepID=UPI00047D3AD0|nr:hypothetical protein [Polaribacter sp. Hel_I_88]|tara:strand:- start:1181 stop:1750 length:570 start_codon:yes stop_codon:yes gene_type:complete
MKIFSTFDEQYQGVYLARFVDCNFYNTPLDYETELHKVQDQLQNPTYVRNFIKSSQSGWKQGKFKDKLLSFLAINVLEEAGDLFDKLIFLKKESQKGDCFELLFDEFVELSKREIYDDPGRRKMYTYDFKSLLRLYGIRLGNNAIIITGVGIKLVGAMQDCEALQLELNKMNYLKKWLQEKNITDCIQF